MIHLAKPRLGDVRGLSGNVVMARVGRCAAQESSAAIPAHGREAAGIFDDANGDCETARLA